MAKKYKKIWNSKQERDAWEAHVDETLARGYALLEKSIAQRAAKKAQANPPRQTRATDP